ncbi:hypothetical protein Q3G72_014158 [Acer saccharum]|nr:hypothetical protein Q3G72_014158 [Acer saccharum]
MLGAGVVLAIARKQLHGKACAMGVVQLSLGLALTGRLAFGSEAYLTAHQDSFLWGGSLLSFLWAGFCTGKVGRRLGFWELYLAFVIVALGLCVHLAYGLEHFVPGFDTSAHNSVDYFAPANRGVRLLGPMWDRLVGLGAVVGFFVALIGGSVAFLIYADGSRGDAGIGMEWWVARRHLQGQRKSPVSVTAVVAILGIALGVGALVTVTAVMSGYQKDIQEKILSTNAHLVVQKYGMDFEAYDDVMQQALAVRGVRAASAFTFNEAMLNAGVASVGILVKGVMPERAADVTDIAANLCMPDQAQGCTAISRAQGTKLLPKMLAPKDGVASVVVGLALYQRLGKPLGTQISITTPVGMASAKGNAPRRLTFRLAGVFRSGMHEFDARLVYMSLPDSQALLGMGDTVNGIEIRADDPEHIEGLAQAVLTAVGRYPYRSLDWRELNQGIFTALKLQKIVMFLVLAFIVVVAAFNIASTLFMAVVEKAREIAVLKSMGAKDTSIMKIFVFEGWITGLLGTGAGVLLGLVVSLGLGQMHLGIAADVYMVDALQVRVQLFEVLVTVGSALGISHLATLYPALKAARARPVDAMRYE